jgi:uncharacterized membrane protein YkoI
MKKIVSTILLAFFCATAIAEETTTPTSLISVLKTLNAQSYSVIKLEYEHHGYEAKVITPQGFLQEVKFDQNGNPIVNNKNKMPLLSMASALELTEKAGYTAISSVKIAGDHTYKIDAVRSSDKKEVDIKVNAETGEIEVEHEWWDIF